ncbi:hypothetical protein B566_EDAN013269 [Ephemera danica]|nr:hypothetical protein B566_EDAN013269 [Ephemera danica]
MMSEDIPDIFYTPYSSSSCKENSEQLVERFLSVLQQTQNKHSWSGGKFINVPTQGWVEKLLFNKDIEHTKYYLHSGDLEY